MSSTLATDFASISAIVRELVDIMHICPTGGRIGFPRTGETMVNLDLCDLRVF
jgi:hypothetical protein